MLCILEILFWKFLPSQKKSVLNGQNTANHDENDLPMAPYLRSWIVDETLFKFTLLNTNDFSQVIAIALSPSLILSGLFSATRSWYISRFNFRLLSLN